jgi:PadR family transcriptional regulator PadR
MPVTSVRAGHCSGPPRKYYAITAEGRHALADFTGQWRLFRDAVDDILAKGTT